MLPSSPMLGLTEAVGQWRASLASGYILLFSLPYFSSSGFFCLNLSPATADLTRGSASKVTSWIAPPSLLEGREQYFVRVVSLR